ncbi:high choriolytic enzyme 2 precursor [Oryzias latipes]|uniref:High choriolytic enzyme 2 n=1 Tax=Oryzias latipes TaxID=8090 RepID=HCE2_ORYLA|nr:high choriolytic enzyme 2 precursor [Oryzias latipes]P31581.1 RecName: Full=High choriolytic enzyme 2; AltName: Full=Choriolysin H 2; AltName: Full=HCE21; AltName: Full=Hatching enzyme zinc-protease subunit HCE 2; Flags: Precursor [Oryzias latipes]AAA49439.1 protease [Oryzias latipes]
MNLASSACLLLLFLLGIAQALPVQNEEGHEEGNKEGHGEEGVEEGDEDDFVDFTTRILTSNNNTDQLLLEGDLVAPTNRNAMKCWYNSCFWKKASNGFVVIPYVISSQYSRGEVATIEGAMRAFNGRTCIRFVRRTNEYDFISVVSKNGCYSELGRKGGQQELSLNRGGCMYSGIIQHELNHALGFQHEQTRSDRDSYVRINWQNIIPASAYNFNKHDTNNLNTPYDYSSIMHYGRDAFSIAYGRDSITPIPNPNVPIGQRNGMSRWDITRSNVLYNCR